MTGNSDYILGIDVGVGSLGVAVISNEAGRGNRLLDGVARIFPASIGAVERRESRSGRTQNKRRRARLETVKKVLKRHLDITEDVFAKERSLHLDKQGKRSSSIVALRDKASRQHVPSEELARALYHIAKSRGIRLTRVTSDSETAASQRKENTQSGEANRQMHAVMSENNLQTVGQYLYWREKQGLGIKAKKDLQDRLDFFIRREDTKSELQLILETQCPFFQSLTKEACDAIFNAVFWEKEAPSIKDKIGTCCYGLKDPATGQKEKRVAVASPLFQRKRLLEEINNIRIRTSNRELRNGTGLLTLEEREQVIEKIQTAKTSKAEQIRKAAKLDADCILSIERAYSRQQKAGTERKIAGDAIYLALKKTALGEDWLNRPLDEQERLITIMRDEEDPDSALQQLSDALPNLTEKEIEELLDISFPSGYASTGPTATRALIDCLQATVTSHKDAEQKCGFFHETAATGEILPNLPYYGRVLGHYCAGGTYHPADPLEKQHGRIANPVVHQSLNQIRKVVNAVVKKYGPPKRIHIELSRDMNKSQEERDKLARENTKNRKKNVDYDNTILKQGKRPSRKYRRALKLHEFQGGICPYTGRNMSIDDIFNGSTDIDHILPRSKTLQDRLGNLVLCDAAANKFKAARSPYDAFYPSYKGKMSNGRPVDTTYNDIMTRINAYPDSKKWRFNADAMDRFDNSDEMLDRFSNDTSYLGKVARQYLTFLVGNPSDVVVLAGGITSDLRYHWGVHNLLKQDEEAGEKGKKDRSDSRHHIIDAIVIACISRSEIKKLQDWAARRDAGTDKTDGIRLEPWPGFREEVRQFIADQRRVTQKPDHNVNRKLHKETAYRILAEDSKGLHVVTTKASLSTLLNSLKKGDAVFDALIPPAKVVKKIRDIADGKGHFYGRTLNPLRDFEETCKDLQQMRADLLTFYRNAPETKEVLRPATKTKPEELQTVTTTDKEQIAYAIERYQELTKRRSFRTFDSMGLTVIRGPVSNHTDRPQGAYHARSNSRIDLFISGDLENGWEVIQTLNEIRDKPPAWRSDPDACLIYSLRQKDELEIWDKPDEEDRRRIVVRLQKMSPNYLVFFPTAKTGTQSDDENAIRVQSLGRFWSHEPVKIIRDGLGQILYREQRRQSNR